MVAWEMSACSYGLVNSSSENGDDLVHAFLAAPELFRGAIAGACKNLRFADGQINYAYQWAQSTDLFVC